MRRGGAVAVCDDPAATDLDEWCSSGIHVGWPEGGEVYDRNGPTGDLGAFAYGLQVDGSWAVTEYSINSRRPSDRNLAKLYDAVADPDTIDLVDPLLARLGELQPDGDALHDLGRWLATTAPDRGPVKVGIAVLGITGIDDELDVLRTLGAHEEFTLYVAVALTNRLDGPEAETELWALAAAVDGWGRIHCVERLGGTRDPHIRDWILREGFRNSVMYEYLAYTAATTGGLLDALRPPMVDRELLTAAGEILEALVNGGPAESLDHYAAGADAVDAFLDLMRRRAETIRDYHAVASIRSYLTAETGWAERTRLGWTATRRAAFEATCDEILGRSWWNDRIAAGLASTDPVELWQADQAARLHGIDTFDLLVTRIEDDPLNGPWFQAWQQADRGRAERLVALARDRLPLDEIATGPADEMGFGPGWLPHTALDWALERLGDHVGIGADLVLVGLRSPVTRNRNRSLDVLRRWPPPPSAATPDPSFCPRSARHSRLSADRTLRGWCPRAGSRGTRRRCRWCREPVPGSGRGSCRRPDGRRRRSSAGRTGRRRCRCRPRCSTRA